MKMYKGIEWLKEEVLELQNNGNAETNQTEAEREIGRLQKWAWDNCVDRVYELINRLDEPETLTQSWIDEHAKAVTYDGIPDQTEVVYVDDLQKLLVPKQEITYEDAIKVIAENIDTDEFSIGLYLEALNNNKKYEFLTEKWIESNTSPVDDEGRLYVWKRDLQNVIVPKESLGISQKLEKVQIPQFVADWLDDNIERYKTVYSFIISLVEVFGDTVPEEVWTYASENPDTMARAYLDGYEVAAEQRYYVMSNDNRMMLVRMMDGKTITEADPFPFGELYDNEKKSYRLSESEIKDYDPRYWAFKEPVEEAEFRLSF